MLVSSCDYWAVFIIEVAILDISSVTERCRVLHMKIPLFIFVLNRDFYLLEEEENVFIVQLLIFYIEKKKETDSNTHTHDFILIYK